MTSLRLEKESFEVYIPKLALNPGVCSPAEGSASAGAYAAKAPKEGVRVPAKEKKKAP
jgi:hypothetical protein